jgi:hypothetical protein
MLLHPSNKQFHTSSWHLCFSPCALPSILFFLSAHSVAPKHKWQCGGCSTVPWRSASGVANPLRRSTSGAATSQPMRLLTLLQPQVVTRIAPSPTSVCRQNSSTSAPCRPLRSVDALKKTTPRTNGCIRGYPLHVRNRYGQSFLSAEDMEY